MSKTVLLVEDDADARGIFEAALSRRGYEVITALHGAEGVHLARRRMPDLILMDIRMPVMDGWQAVPYLRCDPTTAHIPIWAISAYLSEEANEEHCDQRGFDRLISKPIDPRDVVSEVEAFIGPPQSTEE